MFSSRLIWTTQVNRLTELIAQKKRDGEKIIDLTISNPTQADLIYPNNIILNALSMPEALIYTPDPKGLSIARNAIRRYYLDHNRNIDSDAIVVTSSTSEGYSFLFKLLCDAGDEILVPQPGYPLLDFLASLEYVTIKPYFSHYKPESGWSIDISSIQASISPSTAAIIVVNPNNPTGAFLKQDEFESLQKICTHHDLALIVDEVFLDYRDYPLSNITGSAILTSKALTFVLSGLSKICCLPQVKMGWICVGGPTELVSTALERLEWIADTYLSVSSMVQHAAPILLDNRFFLQNQLQERIRANESFLIEHLKSIPYAQLFIREGGWYAVVEIKNGMTDDHMVYQLLKDANTLLHPGFFYGFDHENVCVISLICPTPIFHEGVKRLVRMI